MFASVLSGVINGIDSQLVTVEIDVTNGLPGFTMVGFLASEVKEAQERVRAALHNSGIAMQPKRIIINMSPADIRKAGSGFDLPIAVALLLAYELIPKGSTNHVFFAGELSLNGGINGIHGILNMVGEAKANGCTACIIPEVNAKEGAVIQGIHIYGVSCLQDVIGHLNNTRQIRETTINIEDTFQEASRRYRYDFADISGQTVVRRAAEIAAAGRHNLLISGPPGTGKSMIAKRIPSILPVLSLDEALEVSRIHSVAGTLPEEGILYERPFRMPHHTVSAIGLAGGGSVPKPGEISLAHRGILYLDELPEFQKDALEILRQPLEEGTVRITRVSGTCEFPADFMLVASRNPCKCGYYPGPKCNCSEYEVKRYLHRISRPLLDRIDLHVTSEPVTFEELTSSRQCGESSGQIRKRVERAHEIQKRRYEGTRYRFNGDLSAEALEEYCPLGKEEEQMMKKIYATKQLTARTYHRMLKTARTIADLEQSEQIRTVHLSEAIRYRADEMLMR